MTIERSDEYLLGILNELRNLPAETEWVEFKHNNGNPNEIGEYLSALANSAALSQKINAYLVWGVDDRTHDIVGTQFRPSTCKVGNEELESWLLRLLSPRINFRFYELAVDEHTVILLEIGAAFRHPVQFKNTEFIRVGSYRKKLKDYPEKERELWRVFESIPFEREVAAENVHADALLQLLDYPAYFDLLKLPLPESREGILSTLQADEMIEPGSDGKWHIMNLGAVLFTKKLSGFRSLKRKTIRIVFYKGENRIETVREQEATKGYACGFEGLIESVVNLLPSNEIIGQALRSEASMFPELAVRELVANAIIHQDFHATGTAPLIEIFPPAWKLPIPVSLWSKPIDSWTVRRNPVMKGSHHSCAVSVSVKNVAAEWIRLFFRQNTTSYQHRYLKRPMSIPGPSFLPTVNCGKWTNKIASGPVTSMSACAMFSAIL